MTAPVITSQRIKMTAPVISTSNCMAFVLPSNFSIDTAPEPINPKVKLKQIKERKLAVIKFRGRATESDVAETTKELITTLKENDIKHEGTPILMRYNPPFIPGFFRRNEVGIKIQD
jgi:effector-binding domain-containing protein